MITELSYLFRIASSQDDIKDHHQHKADSESEGREIAMLSL